MCLVMVVACESGWRLSNGYCSGDDYPHYKPTCADGATAHCEGQCYDDTGDENYYGCSCAEDGGKKR